MFIDDYRFKPAPDFAILTEIALFANNFAIERKQYYVYAFYFIMVENRGQA